MLKSTERAIIHAAKIVRKGIVSKDAMALWSKETISLLASTNKHLGNDYRLFFLGLALFVLFYFGFGGRRWLPDPSGSHGEVGVIAFYRTGRMAPWLAGYSQA